MTQIHQNGPGGGSPNLNALATGTRRRTLDAIFQHPLAHNLAWREVVSLIESIGDVTQKRDGEFSLKASDQHLLMKKPPGKDVEGPQVIELRHFLSRAGWSPDAQPTAPEQPKNQAFIVVIDHAGAKIYQVNGAGDEDARRTTAVEAFKHIPHEVDRSQHDADRDETYPDDDRFFKAIVSATAGGDQIVIIGHGKGQSNEADHLRAYLDKHHKAVAARVVAQIAADISNLTSPQLLSLGRESIQTPGS